LNTKYPYGKYQIEIDYAKDSLFDALGMKRLEESYMRKDEISPQERFAYVATKLGSNKAHAQRIYNYASNHWLSFSTPILSYGRSAKGLPISCYLNYIEDTTRGLIDNLSETNLLSTLGGGVGIGFGIRSQDEKSVGIIPHLKTYDMSALAYKQGSTRRGSYAAYLDISHPEIIQFIEIRKPTGDPNMRCQNMHHGINVTDKFMGIIENCMLNPEANDDWDLIDPNTKEVTKTISAKWLWEKILDTRIQTGEPYLHFIDTANKALPDFMKRHGHTIKQSNLCQEIELPTSAERTAICCLSSVNLEYFDEWASNDLFIQDIAELLDNVLDVFIENAPIGLHRAVESAVMERNIGIGQLGFHAYLQKNGIPFEGVMAKVSNRNIAKHIFEKVMQANLYLGEKRGEAPDAVGTGRRFCHTQAIAPNASSSIIMGNTSPSIEPYRSNIYRQDTLSGSYTHFNKWLDLLLKSKKDINYEEVKAEVIKAEGSVQGISCLSDLEKAVFKTAMEIDQRWIIELASDRQEFIDQGQSINLFFQPDCHVKYLHAVHFLAWKSGLKGLYYCRSAKLKRVSNISSSIARKRIEENLSMQQIAEGATCLACE
jgi:ribonucleoside-diphosphate reductase alpha chain